MGEVDTQHDGICHKSIGRSRQTRGSNYSFLVIRQSQFPIIGVFIYGHVLDAESCYS